MPKGRPKKKKVVSEETFKFEAEITELMGLIINAFYSNKDIFLREMISNASDALDKIRYQALKEGDFILAEEPDLFIKIIPDEMNDTLTIYDTGIGMTKEELINNLGTIARSGTKEFMNKLTNDDVNAVDLIGQFGVGFYSAFLVGERVDVITKHEDDEMYKWSSTADGTFSIIPFNDPDLKRGTKIIIHLKDKDQRYLDDYEIKRIINIHSTYTQYPIFLWLEKFNMDDLEADSHYMFEQINIEEPLWVKNPLEVTNEEYSKFYKALTTEWEEPLLHTHFKIEGPFEFTALLYVPDEPPEEMFESRSRFRDVKLYVKRIFITDSCEDIVPHYLSFVRGVIDSSDLPLNVSRELLQQSTAMRAIKKHVVKKIIEMLQNHATANPLGYNKMYDIYSKNIKLGVHEDDQNRDKLIELLRFNSVKHKRDYISLEEYYQNMSPDQKSIYYITGESIGNVDNSPFMEGINKKGYDILFMIDPLDEYVMQKMGLYKGKGFVDVRTNKVDCVRDPDISTRRDFGSLCKFMKSILGANVERVVVTNRLIKSPCILTVTQFGLSANMERILKSQALNNPQPKMFKENKKILELNPEHLLIRVLKSWYEQDSNDVTTINLIWLFYETALIASGFSLNQPGDYAGRIYHMLMVNLFDSINEAEKEEKEERERLDRKEREKRRRRRHTPDRRHKRRRRYYSESSDSYYSPVPKKRRRKRYISSSDSDESTNYKKRSKTRTATATKSESETQPKRRRRKKKHSESSELELELKPVKTGGKRKKRVQKQHISIDEYSEEDNTPTAILDASNDYDEYIYDIEECSGSNFSYDEKEDASA